MMGGSQGVAAQQELRKYSDNEERDDQGKWTGGGDVGPTVTNVSTGQQIGRADAAARMFGAGSKQHLQMIKEYGVGEIHPDGTLAPGSQFAR